MKKISIAVMALIALALPAAAAKRKAPKAKAPAKGEGLWMTSADQAFSIQYPVGWPFPGPSRSVSPPGMNHLFFIASPDESQAVDVAASTPRMSADTYLEVASGVQTGGEKRSPVETATLPDKSTFKHFKSVERQHGSAQFFVQGALTKTAGRFYVTITSPKRHPEPEEWKAILSTLATLRLGASSVGGKSVPSAGKGAKGAAVVNIGADGSTLKLPAPWEVQGWGYTGRFAKPLHSFRRGPMRCELAFLGQAKAGPKEMASGLRAKYFEAGGRKPGLDESELKSKRLANGPEIFYYQIGLPSRDDDPRKQWMLEGFFARGGMTYYYIAAAARDEMAQKDFEKQSAESLDIIGKVEFPR